MPRTVKAILDVDIPDKVTITLDVKKITVKGPKGTVSKDFAHARDVDISLKGKKLSFSAYFPGRSTVAKLGTFKSIIDSAIAGVQSGYTYKMKICYSHFPITCEIKGDDILIKNFLGERAPRITKKAAPTIDVKADKEDVVISGVDKESVGQTAANIQRKCNIVQKDRRVFQDGIYMYESYCGNDLIWKLKI
jgi:large subunit ribosomal protein L6